MPDQMRDEETIFAAVQSQRQRPGALLPILYDIQDSLGYVPPGAVPMIGKELNVSHGVRPHGGRGLQEYRPASAE